jgi:hypothetical protein
MATFFNTGIYGGYDDPQVQIMYIDRFVPIEKIVYRGGGGGTTQYVDRVVYKEHSFPKLKIIKIDSEDLKRIKMKIFRIIYEE